MTARKKLVDPVASATAASSEKITSASQDVNLDLNSPELTRKKRVDPTDS